MKTLKVALDWTPNVNHIGIFIAQQLGFYQYKNLNVEILNPSEDNYELTPGKKLELDLCDFSIAPFETVISLNNKDNYVDAIAIYAILQEDLSSIVTLKSSKLDTPKLLDGKIYASYKARYEDHIVKEMVKNDGGKGDIQIIYPEKLGIWNTVLEGKADATWIFNNWEGIEAESKMIELHKFSLGDFCIPYGYSPVIFTKNSKLIAQKTEYTAFVKATQEGYLYAKNNISEATKILKNFLTDYDKANIDIEKSVKVTAPFFGNEANCGKMQPEKLTAFFKWLSNNQLESSQILEQTFFTNELFV
ncbi:ABC transporter substrate-binding protein [Emticicia oligotrophica]|uniref:ABC transporter substrate-binding protein n=1 Tax=Emticicia oligotrophica TaxID=312279 RepID=UPI00273C4641|nr:ABC transporter substrate-binding protein [Emticicia oligotrophica]